MPHGDQERIVNTWMLDIAQETGQEGRHNVKIAEMLHKVAFLREEVEVPRQLDYLSQVVIWVLLVGSIYNAIDERDKVLIGNWELLKQSILLEQSETEVKQCVFAKRLTVLEHVELPLFKFVHDLQYMCPLPRINIDQLS